MRVIVNCFKNRFSQRTGKIVCILEDIQPGFIFCLCVYTHRIGVRLTELLVGAMWALLHVMKNFEDNGFSPWRNIPAFDCVIIYRNFSCFLASWSIFAVEERSGLIEGKEVSARACFQSDSQRVWIGKSLNDGPNCIYFCWKGSPRIPTLSRVCDPVWRHGSVI